MLMEIDKMSLLSNKINLIRVPEKEDGNAKFWFEDKDQNIIVTLVSGYFDNEMNMRISDNLERIEIRGHRYIMDKDTPEQFKDRALMHIQRNRSIKNVK